MTQWKFRCNQDDPTPEEHRSLIDVRLDALDQATARASLEGRLPVRWRHGWHAYIKTHGRDRDGSLRASVTVVDPSETVVMIRNVRLVKKKSLDRSFR